MKRRILIVGWVVVLGLSSILPLSALFHGVVHIGSRPIQFNSVLDKPIISVGSDVQLMHGSRSVVVVLFGNIRLRGTARDDLVAADGQVYLDRNATADRDVLAVLGTVYQGPGARVSGRLGGAMQPWDGRSQPRKKSLWRLLASNIRLGLAAGLALLLVGTCLTVVFPWQIVLISTTLRDAPLKSMIAGALCVVTFLFLVVPLSLSLAGLPFALLLTGAASFAWLFGLTAAAVVLGRLLSRGPASLLWATAAGLLALAVGLAIPLLGIIVVTLVGLSGAGALAVALVSRSRPMAPLS